MSKIRPLEGIIVADFSRVLAGPLCTMTLADLGATVIKVERPGTGDDTRAWGPPFSATGSTYFESVNRNKQSVTLDLTDPADLELARELALRADVLVENFKPGGMDKLGLGYAELSAANPGLVYASISGFGSAGGAQLPGYDFIVQALGGLMSITGEPDQDPMKAGVALVDVLTAKDASIGVLAALTARASSGAGAHVEVNLLSSLQGALANQGQAYLGAGKVATRMGNEHPSIVPYQLLACADGSVAVACGNDGQFARLCAEIGLPALATDPRFATNTARVAHRTELIPLLEDSLGADTGANWQARFTAVGVPAGKVAGIDEGLAYADSLGLNPLIEVHNAQGEAVGRQVRHPITWTPALDAPTMSPPQLGEHTEAVRAWLGSDVGSMAEFQALARPRP
ncbi:CaiB/BaiF CoA transferase family protein [Paeniglutamicibacter sulfureus]|uniref:Crotonobetainyl-CoA:carnitine CoA-transferase CaiB-like acyl-CoA transferase n=1 Tax=Paeniglutamicibacter sulfureus TaxID=43666 RepID=A0ABU2BGM6_9MICC|nr:CoA transferase [Paeniglutamicibacter sulfureus]MDR7357750.1 crotonobetainyl-CoA:carnitine CoA-transferase CaiB-like acyl-CoA transferase [Paeniglutamicibacter sulfureus]